MTALHRPRSLEPRPRDGWVVAALAAVVAVPFVVATVRALTRGWLAVGDNGNFLIRSRDVLTSDHPLLGAWSSASIPIGENVNHPGPLLFDLFAVPAKLGDAGGLAVGVLLIHLACIVLIGLFGWRAGGVRLAAASLFATAALAWTMGSELLYDPWNPHVLLFPVLLLLVLTVAMARGDAAALPVAVGVASLVVQTHLSYTLLIPPLLLFALAWLVRIRGRAVVRPVVAAGLVGIICWSQPVVDQLAGEGNLGTLAANLGTDQEILGGSMGVRAAAEVLAVPPWWARDSFAEAFRVPPGQSPLVGDRPNIDGLPSAGVAVASLLALAAVILLSVRRTHRDRQLGARAAAVVAAVALALATVVTMRLPVGGVGVPPHQVRYLWPVAAFSTGVVVLALAPRRWSVSILGGATVVLAVLTIPTHAVPAGPQDDSDAIPVVLELGRQLDRLADQGTLLYDTSELRFAEPWTSALMALLQERGIDFTVDDPVWSRQLGTGRSDEGEAGARIFVREGDAAREVPDGVRRIAYVEGLDRDERRELMTLERSLVDIEVALNDDGRNALERGQLASFASGVPTAEQLIAFGDLAALRRERLLDVPAERAADVDRYAELRYRWDRHTVALFLDPTPYDR